MRRTADEQQPFSLGRQKDQAPGITRIDRETLEGVMRDDVFLASDGKALALDAAGIWTNIRRTTRRA